MFTTRKQLARKSGKKGVDRFEFLQELVNEFYQASSLDSQEQVLANLANFSYDPLNYHFLREIKVIELFINALESRNQYFVEYSMKGLSNLSCDPSNQQIIIEKKGLNSIKKILKSDNPDLVNPALATLTFLCTSPLFPSGISLPDLQEDIRLLLQPSKTSNRITENLAKILSEELEKINQR